MSSSPSERRKTSADIGEYLTFFIAEVQYAVSLDYVREVIPYDTVTRVPGMPETVRGVTNLRGSVVPVIDLALKFSLPQIEVSQRTCIVLVETPFAGNLMLLGLLTEEVGQVLAADRDQLLMPPSFGTPVHADYLDGMLPIGKSFALVLNIGHVLSQDEILSNRAPAIEAEAAVPEPEVNVDEAWVEPAESAAEVAPAARAEG